MEPITKTPGVCGGRACIAGHRVRVSDIVVWYKDHGYPPEEIVKIFPGIALADIYAAISYYLRNCDEIEQEYLSAEKMAATIQSTIPSKIPPEVRNQFGG